MGGVGTGGPGGAGTMTIWMSAAAMILSAKGSPVLATAGGPGSDAGGLATVAGGGQVPTLTLQVFAYLREANVNQAAAAALLLAGCAPQACHLDDVESWSTNEIAINWNAALVQLAGWLADQWLGTRYLVAVGILAGATLGIYLTAARFRMDPPAPPDHPDSTKSDQQ